LWSIQVKNERYSKQSDHFIISRLNFFTKAKNAALVERAALFLWSRRESNSYLEFRKLLFYPLNYGTVLMCRFQMHGCANCKLAFKVQMCKLSMSSSNPFAHLHVYLSAHYLTTEPLCRSSFGETNVNLPSPSSAIRIIPCDTIPFISRGSRFTRMLTFLPMMASGS
jgi:hypothetical protein